MKEINVYCPVCNENIIELYNKGYAIFKSGYDEFYGHQWCMEKYDKQFEAVSIKSKQSRYTIKVNGAIRLPKETNSDEFSQMVFEWLEKKYGFSGTIEIDERL